MCALRTFSNPDEGFPKALGGVRESDREGERERERERERIDMCS